MPGSTRLTHRAQAGARFGVDATGCADAGLACCGGDEQERGVSLTARIGPTPARAKPSLRRIRCRDLAEGRAPFATKLTGSFTFWKKNLSLPSVGHLVDNMVYKPENRRQHWLGGPCSRFNHGRSKCLLKVVTSPMTGNFVLVKNRCLLHAVVQTEG